jgi:hypothetical protein
MLTVDPTSAILEQQDRLSPERPYVTFMKLFEHECRLYPDGGFNPMWIRTFMLNKNLASSILALEMAYPPDFTHLGVSFPSYELEGRGGRVFHNPTKDVEGELLTGLPWVATGFTVIGDPAIVSSNKITLVHKTAEAFFFVKATSTILQSPLFRLRRSYPNSVAAEVLGIGTGTETHFTATAINLPICPSSIKISFTDGVGVKTDLIRDNGTGRLVTLPPNGLLSPTLPSTIDYLTGAIVLNFSASHIPIAANITMAYEHNGGDPADVAEYRIDWRING